MRVGGLFPEIKIFAGNSNIALADEIASIMGKPLGKSVVSTFEDGEISVNVQETVRGRDVFIIQSTSDPVNNNLMELLILIERGVVAAGDEIRHTQVRKGVTHTAYIDNEGYVVTSIDRYVSPSPALGALVGSSINGNVNWVHTKTGKTLAELWEIAKYRK